MEQVTDLERSQQLLEVVQRYLRARKLVPKLQTTRRQEAYAYGFDTGYHDSAQYPILDLDWVKGQCVIMIAGLRKAGEVERAFLRAKTQKTRAKYADQVRGVCGEPTQALGMAAMLNVLSGDL